jgi:anti-sigma B factor antagonist
MELKISRDDKQPGTAIVSFPTDHLDAGNVKDFRAAIQAIAEAHETLVLDMSRLTFVDSSGLGALLSCLRTMNGKRGQLLLFGMAKPVRALFELVRMHRIFSIYNSQDEALMELKAA